MQKNYKYARMSNMITEEEIKNLAHLARIEVTDAEVTQFAQDFESILGYVDQINMIDSSAIEVLHLQKNVMRDDEHPHIEGQYVEKLLADAPDAQDGFYKMPKIL